LDYHGISSSDGRGMINSCTGPTIAPNLLHAFI
jgi:hypothetical protein